MIHENIYVSALDDGKSSTFLTKAVMPQLRICMYIVLFHPNI